MPRPKSDPKAVLTARIDPRLYDAIMEKRWELKVESAELGVVIVTEWAKSKGITIPDDAPTKPEPAKAEPAKAEPGKPGVPAGQRS